MTLLVLLLPFAILTYHTFFLYASYPQNIEISLLFCYAQFFDLYFDKYRFTLPKNSVSCFFTYHNHSYFSRISSNIYKPHPTCKYRSFSWFSIFYVAIKLCSYTLIAITLCCDFFVYISGFHTCSDQGRDKILFILYHLCLA